MYMVYLKSSICWPLPHCKYKRTQQTVAHIQTQKVFEMVRVRHTDDDDGNDEMWNQSSDWWWLLCHEYSSCMASCEDEMGREERDEIKEFFFRAKETHRGTVAKRKVKSEKIKGASTCIHNTQVAVAKGKFKYSIACKPCGIGLHNSHSHARIRKAKFSRNKCLEWFVWWRSSDWVCVLWL